MSDQILGESQEEVEAQTMFKNIASRERTVTYEKRKNGFDLMVRYKLPSLKQKDTADMLYSKIYNKLLRDDDHMTVKELIDTATRRGMWSDEDSLRIANIDDEIIAKKELVLKEKAKKKKEELEKELAALRDEKFRLALRAGQITSTAIENLAERERTLFLLTNCVFTVDENGQETPLYSTKQDIDNETNMEKLDRILLDGKAFWSNEGLTDFLHLDD